MHGFWSSKKRDLRIHIFELFELFELHLVSHILPNCYGESGVRNAYRTPLELDNAWILEFEWTSMPLSNSRCVATTGAVKVCKVEFEEFEKFEESISW
jgi:hypothetical protein